MDPDLQSKDPHPGDVLDRGSLVIIMQILSLVREETGLAKRIRSLWSVIYWVRSRLEGIKSVCWVYGYKKNVKWFQDLQSQVNVEKQEKIDITTGSLKRILGTMPNWKSPGPDLVQVFWLKNSSSLHERVRLQLKNA